MSTVARNILAYEKAMKWQFLSGSLARRLIIRSFMFSFAISALPLMQIVCNFDTLMLYPASFDECSSDLGFLNPNSFMGRVLRPVTPNAFPHIGYARCKENVNVTIDVARELMDSNLLNYGSRTLCLGRESGSAVLALRKLGFYSVDGVNRHPFFARKQKVFLYELHYEDNSFDFLIARDLEKMSVPALVVNEMERILKPGGIGAVILHVDGSAPGSLIRSAMPVSPFLKSSSVVHVASLNEKNTLVAFRKNFDHVKLLVDHLLPADCPSLRRNKPYIDRMEALVEAKPTNPHGSNIAYLPDFLGITSNMRLVYVYMGKREGANFRLNKWFLPSYPIDWRAFKVYIVDHNALVLASHVREPGVNFIYHPGLSGNLSTNSDSAVDEDIEEIPMDDVEIDFLAWFKETVMYSDFVVLKMNAGGAELKFLSELFESGAICFMDELFLHCSDPDLAEGNGEAKLGKTCMDLFKNLRRAGVYVHQWW